MRIQKIGTVGERVKRRRSARLRFSQGLVQARHLTNYSKITGRAIVCVCALLFAVSVSLAEGATETDDDPAPLVPDAVPDIREDETNLKLQKGDFVIVPIPFSNPTLDTGLIVGGAYFYAQTEEQKNAQPASVTAAAGLYSSSDSLAYGLAQQNYWNENTWRFNGLAAHVDLKLNLSAPEDTSGGEPVKWLVVGEFLRANISRRIAGKWYAGLIGRYVSMNEEFNVGVTTLEFDTESDTRSVGLGIDAEFDSRDKPLNSYTGKMFEVAALHNAEAFGSSDTYQSYSARYRSYHSLSPSIILAWEAQACTRSGVTPLWDACRVHLRGFPATDFLGKSSASAQVEARWRFHKKWGAVAFLGGGNIRNSYSETSDQDLIPSYGVGIRFMVLSSQRINARLDFARSKGSDAFYLSLGEAF